MNILLLDGGKAFGHSAGRLNHTLHQTARSALQAQGHHTRETVIDEGNAPLEAFTRAGDFFGGAGVDAVYLPFHKANEFIGTSQLPTFICNDVIKNPQVEQYIVNYIAHLEKVFGPA